MKKQPVHPLPDTFMSAFSKALDPTYSAEEQAPSAVEDAANVMSQHEPAQETVEQSVEESSCGGNIQASYGKKKMKEDKLDPVNKKAVKKDFDDRQDQDIDNDGDVDSSDEYLHKRRKAISKAVTKEEQDPLLADENPVTENGQDAISEEKEDCEKCEGTGEVDGEECDHCDGEGYHDDDDDDDDEEDMNESTMRDRQVVRAMRIAKDMAGNMTGATKAIEKLKKGLSSHPKVKGALQLANEEVEQVDEAKIGNMGPYTMAQVQQAMKVAKCKGPQAIALAGALRGMKEYSKY